jgi:bacterioferritin-associated ferredoxin
MTQTLLEQAQTTECFGTCRTCPSVGSCGERLVCRCLKVTEHEIVTAIRIHGLKSVRELRTVTMAGDGCTCCHKELKTYLEIYSPSCSSEPICSLR